MSNGKDDDFTFSRHSLERGLERMLDIQPPYYQKHYNNVEALIRMTMEWNGINCKWVLHDYELELVIRNNNCVTIVPYDSMSGVKPVSDYMKTYSKRRKQQGNRRNAKHKDMKWRE